MGALERAAWDSHNRRAMIKLVVVLALFGAAYTEPGYHGHHGGHYGGHHGGYHGGYYGHGYGYGYGLWGRKKREAEPTAEAEADPYLVYGHGYGHGYGYLGGYYGHGLGYYGHGLGYYGHWGRKKREAEPTAEAEADPYLVYGHGYGLGH